MLIFVSFFIICHVLNSRIVSTDKCVFAEYFLPQVNVYLNQHHNTFTQNFNSTEFYNLFSFKYSASFSMTADKASSLPTLFSF